MLRLRVQGLHDKVVNVMEDAKRDEIRARWENATPPPWKACGADRGGCVCGLVWATGVDEVVAQVWPSGGDVTPTDAQRNKDAAAIAHAPDDVAALLAESNELRTADLTILLQEKKQAEAQRNRLRDEHMDALGRVADLLHERDRLRRLLNRAQEAGALTWNDDDESTGISVPSVTERDELRAAVDKIRKNALGWVDAEATDEFEDGLKEAGRQVLSALKASR